MSSRDPTIDPSSLEHLCVAHGPLDDSAAQSDWASKKLVWVPQESVGFVAASIVNEDKDDCVVQLQESGKKITVPKDVIQKMNPPKFEKVEDMANLTYLNEASVLYNLKSRYYSGLIYTYSGLFCVVVNPYKRLPIYREEIVEWYKGKKRHERPPHIFAIADTAYRNMLQDREDQSILCTGESGAGKTENTKKVIQYLASVATSTKNQKTTPSNVLSKLHGELEAQLLKANPILEAFGNAKTIKNDNSSRFGKFIRINFDTSGFIAGANIETYLLEKARVIRQAPEERSFHIFYQLIASATPKLKEKLLLTDAPSHSYLSHGMIEVPGLDEKQAFQETTEAMSIMGITDEDQQAIFRILSAVLHLGNLEFKQERTTDQATLPNQAVAEKVAHLLGVPLQELTKAFLKPKLKIGRETVSKAQTKEQVEFAVEAISKAIYERLFRWLVTRINKSLDRAKRQGVSFVGILDIAGFEIFQFNSFEQLCINYTNEKLQQLFNHTMFVLEQEEYSREGIPWDFIDFGLDLQPTIDLIEKPVGILALLDEECFFPKATDKSFVEKLFKQQEGNPKLFKPEFRSTSDFGVCHYAGRVDYQAAQWLTKNMDPLNDNVVALLQSSNEPLVQAIWKDAEIVSMSATAGNETTFGPTRTVRKGMLRTVSQLYKESLIRLMSVLQNTNPNFVRCIIPNHEKKAGRIDVPLVLDQLKCNGVLEGIRICRQGFPSRVAFQEFRQRYEILTPDLISKGYMDGRKAAELMVQRLELSPELYRIGQSKIFFKAGVLAQLEEDRDLRLTAIMVNFQAHCRCYLAKKAVQQRIQDIQAIRIIQRNCVAYLKLRNWPWWRLFTKVRPLLSVTRQEEIVAAKEEELRMVSRFSDWESVRVDAVQEALAKTSASLTETRTAYEEAQNKLVSLESELQIEHESFASLDERERKLRTDYQAALEEITDLENRENEFKTLISELETQKKTLSDQKILRARGVFQSEQVGDISDQLEVEEQHRQKLQLEKGSLEQTLKSLNEEHAALEDKYTKLEKEKKSIESRLSDLSTHLTDEEERSKQLMKLKSKYESSISELEEKLSKEQASRQDLERAKRRLETEVSERAEQGADHTRLIDELKQQVANLEAKLSETQQKLDDEVMAKTVTMKQFREAESLVQELKDDLEAEKAARDRAENRKRDLKEELEALRLELIDSGTNSEAQAEALRKHEAELSNARKQIESDAAAHEAVVAELRKKYNANVEQLTEQLEAMKRVKVAMESSKSQLEAGNADLINQLNTALAAKAESEKKRRAVEQKLNDKFMKLEESERQRVDIEERFSKMQAELEVANKALETSEAELAKLSRSDANNAATIAELKQSLEDETRAKLALQTRLRQAESEREAAKDALDEEEQNKQALEKHVQMLQQQMDDVKAKVAEDAQQLEGLEDIRKKLQREKDELANRNEELTAQVEKLEKSRRKLQGELEDANHALAAQRSDQVNSDRRLKKLEASLADATANARRLQEEKDQVDKDMRERETQLLTRDRELEDLQERLEESERQRANLSHELEELVSHTDDAGKSKIELEQINFQLENQLKELKQQFEELEDDQAQLAMEKQRADLQINALKTQLERELANRNEGFEEQRRQLLKQLREAKEELEDEKKQRATALLMRKKIESDLADANQRGDAADRQREEAAKQLKRLQGVSIELKRDLDASLKARDDAITAMRELEKRIRTAEAERAQAMDDLSTAERVCRTAKLERDEALEEANNALTAKNTLLEEKKRLESAMVHRDEELEEAQTAREEAEDRYKRTLGLLEQAQVDLGLERTNAQRIETQRATFEKQIKELREKLAEQERDSGKRLKLQVATMEERLAAMDEQLENENKERQNANRTARRLDKRLKEVSLQLEEEKAYVVQLKDQLEKTQTACKRNKQNLEAMEDEASNLRTQKRRIQRDLEETTEQKEAVERELQMLRAKLNRGTRSAHRGSTGASRPSTQTGGGGTPEDAQSAADVDVSGSNEDTLNETNSSNTNSTNKNNSTKSP
ncbi:Myosin-11 [Taenia solium]|eukprot:TsM_000565700 transcript=TsM_000565700 gene=TsM_000565700